MLGMSTTPEPAVRFRTTSIDLLSKCGVAWEYSYQRGIKRPPKVAMIVGTAVDHAANSSLQRKIDGAPEMGPEEAAEVASSKLEEEWSYGVALDEEEASRGAAVVKGHAMDKAAAIAESYVSMVAPRIRPKRVQREWELELLGLNAFVTGVMDVEEEDGGIRDTKSTARNPKAEVVADSPQLSTYAMAKHVIDGTPAPVSVRLDFLVAKFVGAGRYGWAVSYEPMESFRDETDFAQGIARMERAVRLVRAGAFMPARPDDWWCSEKWCGYWDICPFARRRVAVALSSAVGR